MNSMEEEATQLESEVLRKILRQPKESAHQERKGNEKTPHSQCPRPCSHVLGPPVALRLGGRCPGRSDGTKEHVASHSPHRESDGLPGVEQTEGRGQEASWVLTCLTAPA